MDGKQGYVDRIMTFWLTITLLLHLLGVILWLGGIVFFLVVFAPAVHELEPGVGMRALNHGRISLETIAWISIVILLFSGIAAFTFRAQAAGAPLPTSYTIVLSFKIVLFVSMLVHHCLQVFKYAPRIASLTAALSPQPDSWPEPLLSQWQRWFLLLKINSVVGVIIVILGLMLDRTLYA